MSSFEGVQAYGEALGWGCHTIMHYGHMRPWVGVVYGHTSMHYGHMRPWVGVEIYGHTIMHYGHMRPWVGVDPTYMVTRSCIMVI